MPVSLCGTVPVNRIAKSGYGDGADGDSSGRWRNRQVITTRSSLSVVRRDEALFGEAVVNLLQAWWTPDSGRAGFGNGTVLSVYRLAKTGGDTRLIYFSLARTSKMGEFATSPDRDYQ